MMKTNATKRRKYFLFKVFFKRKTTVKRRKLNKNFDSDKLNNIE